MNLTNRLAELGLALPPAPTPVGSYVPALVAGGLCYTSGQLPLVNGVMLHPGLVGREVSEQQAAEAARAALLNALACLHAVLDGRMDRLLRVARLTCYVASAPGFHAQPRIANAASDLLVALFDEAGKHTRCAVGVAELPLGACVELDLILHVHP